jgi:hypothetical protein
MLRCPKTLQVCVPCNEAVLTVGLGVRESYGLAADDGIGLTELLETEVSPYVEGSIPPGCKILSCKERLAFASRVMTDAVVRVTPAASAVPLKHLKRGPEEQ